MTKVCLCALLCFGTGLAHATEAAPAAAATPSTPAPPVAPEAAEPSYQPHDPRAGLSAAMVDKLDKQQLFDVLAGGRADAPHPERGLVAIAAFAFILLTMLAVLTFRRGQERERYETIRHIIDKGGEIPKELLMGQQAPGSDLRRGVVFVALGVGLGLFLWTIHSPGWGAGLLIGFLGVGHLVAWKLEPKPLGVTPGR